jgi:hypothetical protein
MTAAIFIGVPVIGFLVGLVVRRWKVVLAITLAGLVGLAVGIPFGWWADEEVPATGGAMILASVLLTPFFIAMGVGCVLGQALTKRRRTV